jgi:hypothetical protein
MGRRNAIPGHPVEPVVSGSPIALEPAGDDPDPYDDPVCQPVDQKR